MRTTTLKQNFTIDIERGREIDRTTDLKEKWYGMNSTDNLGCCTYLYKKYNYPETYEDFYNAYTKDNTNFGKESGRNENYLLKMSKLLAIKDENRFEIEDYYSYIIKKLIVDTLDGSKKESEVNEIIKKKGYRTESPTLIEDLKYGIDIKVYEKNKLIYMIQVKPNTFFKGNRNMSLINDRKKALVKERKTKEKYNVNTYYVIYEKKTGKFIKNNGKLLHHLKDLINADGTIN